MFAHLPVALIYAGAFEVKNSANSSINLPSGVLRLSACKDSKTSEMIVMNFDISEFC
jgi:hypothetical protein